MSAGDFSNFANQVGFQSNRENDFERQKPQKMTDKFLQFHGGTSKKELLTNKQLGKVRSKDLTIKASLISKNIRVLKGWYQWSA